MKKSNCKPRYGDVIFVDRGIYKHYGIYAGENRVIHFASENDFDMQNADVHDITLGRFLKDGYLQIDTISSARYPSEEIVRRARSYIGTYKGSYNLLFNNCEHFARMCQSGIAASYQVQKVMTGLVVVTVVTVGTVTVINALSDKKDEKKES